jgi:hypothetical protein
MGGIQSADAMKIFERCWKTLDEARIPFTPTGASRAATRPRASGATSAIT